MRIPVFEQRAKHKENLKEMRRLTRPAWDELCRYFRPKGSTVDLITTTCTQGREARVSPEVAEAIDARDNLTLLAIEEKNDVRIRTNFAPPSVRTHFRRINITPRWDKLCARERSQSK